MTIPPASTPDAFPPPGATSSHPRQAIEELAARLQALADDVEVLKQAMAGLASSAADGVRSGFHDSARGSEPTPLYPSLDAWIEAFFAAVYTRPIGGDLRWCPRWYEHPEAAIRLELLWRSWEVYRLRPLGAVEWHRDILDHQLPTLLSDRGPFAACTPDRHEPSTPLPVAPTPPGWWDTDDGPTEHGAATTRPSTGTAT